MIATEAAAHAMTAVNVNPGVTPTTWAIAIASSPFIYALFKFWPAMKKLSNDRGDALDEERREDMKAMRLEIAEIKTEAREANRRANAAEIKLTRAMMVIRVLSTKVREQWPDDPILKDASAILDDMASEIIPPEMLAQMARLRKAEEGQA